MVLSGHTRQVAGPGLSLDVLAANAELGDGNTADLHLLTGPVDSRKRGARTIDRLVGRDVEMAVLNDRARAALSANGRAVTLIGDAGIGKTRLITELRHTRPVDVRWLTVNASPPDTEIPSATLLAVIARWHDWPPDVAADRRVAELTRLVPDNGRAVATIARLFASESAEGQPIDERAVIDAATSWLLAVARDGPTVIAIEDLHWVDTSTVAVIGAWVSATERSSVMLLLTARPEFDGAWVRAPNHTLLRVGPLDVADTRDLVAQRLGQPDHGDRLVDALAARSDGVPLFAEELASIAIDRPDSVLDVPMTLQDLLDARLQRVGQARRVAQVASVIGRDFTVETLSSVSGTAEAGLDALVTQLVDAEIIRRTADRGDKHYEFRHAGLRQRRLRRLLPCPRRGSEFTALTPVMRERRWIGRPIGLGGQSDGHSTVETSPVRCEQRVVGGLVNEPRTTRPPASSIEHCSRSSQAMPSPPTTRCVFSSGGSRRSQWASVGCRRTSVRCSIGFAAGRRSAARASSCSRRSTDCSSRRW